MPVYEFGREVSSSDSENCGVVVSPDEVSRVKTEVEMLTDQLEALKVELQMAKESQQKAEVSLVAAENVHDQMEKKLRKMQNANKGTQICINSDSFNLNNISFEGVVKFVCIVAVVKLILTK